jgi:hypothetical protein
MPVKLRKVTEIAVTMWTQNDGVPLSDVTVPARLKHARLCGARDGLAHRGVQQVSAYIRKIRGQQLRERWA